jgi:hypothetical protein
MVTSFDLDYRATLAAVYTAMVTCLPFCPLERAVVQPTLLECIHKFGSSRTGYRRNSRATISRNLDPLRHLGRVLVVNTSAILDYKFSILFSDYPTAVH